MFRLWIGKGYIFVLSCLILGTASAWGGEVKMEHDKNIPQYEIDFAAGTEGTKFLAAVKFRRTRVELVRAPGFEKEQNLNIFPNITWWWYEVDFEPVTLILGEWKMGRMLTVKCRHYLATAVDDSWVGIIVRDKNMKEKWLKDYILRAGRIIDPQTGRVLGEVKALESLIDTYCKTNGL